MRQYLQIERGVQNASPIINYKLHNDKAYNNRTSNLRSTHVLLIYGLKIDLKTEFINCERENLFILVIRITKCTQQAHVIIQKTVMNLRMEKLSKNARIITKTILIVV